MNRQLTTSATVNNILIVILMLTWCVPCYTGCGGGNRRVKVTGTVSLDGRPLESGLINFRPVDVSAAPSSGGGIVDGRFHMPAKKGLMPGTYKVRIESFKETGRMLRDPSGGPEYPETARIRFKEGDTLDATIAAEGTNHFAFQLTAVR